MAAPSLYGREAMAFFDELKKADGGNSKCVDCGTNTPLWASLSYGTYFCLECSGVHRNLGVHISFVRSLNMDSWSSEQQARMRAGGNTAFREYMRGCGMPEALQSGGGAYVGRESQAEGAIREKYHTTSAAAYKSWLADRARGNGPPAPARVAYEPPPPPPNYNAPRPQRSGSGPSGANNGTLPPGSQPMQGFGSQGVSSGEPDGLDALMASLGSGLGTARSALASAKSAALPVLGSAVGAVRASETFGSVAERAKRAAAIARGRLEEAASFNTQRDLAHLSAGQRHGSAGGSGAGGSPGGWLSGGVGQDAAEGEGLGFGAVAGSVLSAGLGLWGLARAVVDEAVTFDAAADLAHLARPSREAAASAAGVFGGFGAGDETASAFDSSDSPGWERGGVDTGLGGAGLAGASDGGAGGAATLACVAAQAPHWKDDAASGAREGLAADGWGDDEGGWDEAGLSRIVAPPQAQPHLGSAAPTQTAIKSVSPVQPPAVPSAAQATKGDGWNDTSWADADDW